MKVQYDWMEEQIEAIWTFHSSLVAGGVAYDNSHYGYFRIVEDFEN